jgi:hypothetical protein
VLGSLLLGEWLGTAAASRWPVNPAWFTPLAARFERFANDSGLVSDSFIVEA